MCVSRQCSLHLARRTPFARQLVRDRTAKFVAGIGKQHSLDPAILDGVQLLCPFYTPCLLCLFGSSVSLHLIHFLQNST